MKSNVNPKLTVRNLSDITVREHEIYNELYPATPPSCKKCRILGDIFTAGPIAMIKEGKEYVVISNRTAYRCAVQFKERKGDVTIIICQMHGLNKIEIFRQVLLDSLSVCPGEKRPEIRRALIISNSYEKHREDVEKLFGVSHRHKLAKICGISKATMNRLMGLKGERRTEEIERLAKAHLDPRGRGSLTSSSANVSHKIEGDSASHPPLNARRTRDDHKNKRTPAKKNKGLDDNKTGMLFED